MKIELLEPFGYCHGVKNALNIVTNLRRDNPSSKIVLSRPLIHNEYTNKKLQEDFDICALKEGEKIEEGSFLVFSAHGLTSKDVELAKETKAKLIDTTCPFLKSAKNEIIKDLANGNKVIFIGKNHHPETNFVLDIDKRIEFIDILDLRKSKLLSLRNLDNTIIYPQSTISLDDYNLIKDILKKDEYKNVKLHSICFECLKRWEKSLTLKVTENDAFIVVGSSSSSNSVEFYNLLKNHYFLDVYLITDENSALEIKEKLIAKDTVYIVSASSAPSELVLKIKEVLAN